MTQITAKVLADSLSPQGKRITTMQLTYHRFIHSEFMTHRAFSRNAASSRAIPVSKVVEQVREDPAIPLHWGANQPGMQAFAEVTDTEHAEKLWRESARYAAEFATSMVKLGLHKQVVNRVLEPYQWMHTLVTATEWQNFFTLRDHPDAQPEIQALARAMRHAMEESTPQRLGYGQWHLPYVSDEEARKLGDKAPKVSAARCARVSYNKHDGEPPTLEEDLALFDRLVGSTPMHASPLEHQAQPGLRGSHSRNFLGWLQFRERYEYSRGVNTNV